jgi:hypothetical protein
LAFYREKLSEKIARPGFAEQDILFNGWEFVERTTESGFVTEVHSGSQLPCRRDNRWVSEMTQRSGRGRV